MLKSDRWIRKMAHEHGMIKHQTIFRPEFRARLAQQLQRAVGIDSRILPRHSKDRKKELSRGDHRGGERLTKFAASSLLPCPLYFAT